MKTHHENWVLGPIAPEGKYLSLLGASALGFWRLDTTGLAWPAALAKPTGISFSPGRPHQLLAASQRRGWVWGMLGTRKLAGNIETSVRKQEGAGGRGRWVSEFAFPSVFQRASQVALVIKNPRADAGDARDAGSIPGLGRSLGGGHGNPLQYSCLENPMDRGAWRATVHGVAQSCTLLKWHSMHAVFQILWRLRCSVDIKHCIFKCTHSHSWRVCFEAEVWTSGWNFSPTFSVFKLCLYYCNNQRFLSELFCARY